jgi:hypothetical protein
MNMRRNFAATNIIIILALTGLFFFGKLTLFTLTYVAVFIIVTVRTLMMNAKKRVRFYTILTYGFFMVLQIVAGVTVVFADDVQSVPEQYVRRFFGILIILLPMLMSRYISVGKYAGFYLPSIQEAATISFAQLKSGLNSINSMLSQVSKAGKRISPSHVKEIIYNLPRHDSFRYINDGSLTPEYFAKAAEHLDDPGLYLVISNTGSPVSEIISVFTQTQYNHASISFDRDLETIVSYNGGDRVIPPGMNHEMLEYFNQKPDASVLVYRLPCTPAQKQRVLDKVREINQEGSAYNIMGLVVRYSHKPNIMFCSQFVYRMLEHAELTYFSKPDANVKPTDLIELDYHKKLEFCYEIKLNGEENHD